jgi:DNA-binding NarL/FixJ family response regulator
MLADDDLGDFWHRARAAAHARGSVFAVHSTNLWQGFWHRRRGELDEALSCLRAALDQGQIWGHAELGASYTRAFMVLAHLDRGDLAAARRTADEGLALSHPGEGGRLLEQAAARLLVEEGRYTEALAALDAVSWPIEIPNPAWNPWRAVATDALHGLGRTEEAIELAEDAIARLRVWGAPSFLGGALRRMGAMRGAAGVEQLREAVDLLSGTSAVVELARAQGTLGASPDVADDEAVPLLRAASEAAFAAGAEPIRAAACAELRRRGQDVTLDGVPVRRPSATERRIADLAAAGLSLREIAQELFLAPGTVQAVLESVGVGEPGGDGFKFVSSPATEARRYPTGGGVQ